MEHLIAPLLFMLGAFICGAIGEGISDGERAIDNNPVEHRVSASMRVFLALALASVMVWVKGFPWWDVLLLAIAGLAAFNPVFRYTMNKRRGLDWRYVSPSNKYDKWWIRRNWNEREDVFNEVIHLHATVYNCKAPLVLIHVPEPLRFFMHVKLYRAIIHSAGKAQYITETIFLALSTWGYFHFTNN